MAGPHSGPREAESSGVPFKVLSGTESHCGVHIGLTRTRPKPTAPSEQLVMRADSVAPSACGVTGERTGGAVREVRLACAEEVKRCPHSGLGGTPGGAGCLGAQVILQLVKCRNSLLL